MSDTVSEQIDLFLRLCVPYVVMAVLFLLNMISFSTPLYATIEVPLLLMMIYYWSIFRPTLMPPFLVFLAGLCLDLLSGMAVGVSPFVFLLVRQIIAEQRIFLMAQPFGMIWLGFIIVSAVAILAQWAFHGLLQFQWTPILPVFLMMLSGVLLFPVVSMVLTLSHRILPSLQDHYSAVK